MKVTREEIKDNFKFWGGLGLLAVIVSGLGVLIEELDKFIPSWILDRLLIGIIIIIVIRLLYYAYSKGVFILLKRKKNSVKHDANGLLVCKFYYDNGRGPLEAMGKKRTKRSGDGSLWPHKVGVWRYFYRSGNLKRETVYDEKGRKNGIEIEYLNDDSRTTYVEKKYIKDLLVDKIKKKDNIVDKTKEKDNIVNKTKEKDNIVDKTKEKDNIVKSKESKSPKTLEEIKKEFEKIPKLKDPDKDPNNLSMVNKRFK